MHSSRRPYPLSSTTPPCLSIILWVCSTVGLCLSLRWMSPSVFVRVAHSYGHFVCTFLVCVAARYFDTNQRSPSRNTDIRLRDQKNCSTNCLSAEDTQHSPCSTAPTHCHTHHHAMQPYSPHKVCASPERNHNMSRSNGVYGSEAPASRMRSLTKNLDKRRIHQHITLGAKYGGINRLAAHIQNDGARDKTPATAASL